MSAIENKQLVVVASTMRSGSTLLKALLSEGDEVSNLPETNFQKLQTKKAFNHLCQSDPNRILVLKKPAWYNEIGTYPTLPNEELNSTNHSVKTIVLLRDVMPTVVSLRKMTFRFAANWFAPITTNWLANRYWAGVSEKLFDLSQSDSENVTMVRYEDLTARPIDETKRLFEFIGSPSKQGVDTYKPPGDYKWRWGTDDGSDNIKSLKVQSSNRTINDSRLQSIIENSDRIAEIREKIGYPAS